MRILFNFETSTTYIKITPNDGYGDGAAVSSSAFTIDIQAPDAPVVTNPANGAIVESASYTVTGTAEANSLITISGGAATATGTATGGAFSIMCKASGWSKRSRTTGGGLTSAPK